MKFHLGKIPQTAGFAPDADPSWNQLREPSPWVMQPYALPIALLAFLAVGCLWIPLLTNVQIELHSIPLILSVIIVIVPIHELIHAAFHPGVGSSPDSILGFWPKTLLFYAHYCGELSRNRFITILLIPFLFLSLAPLAVCAIAGHTHSFVVATSVMNAAFAGGDIFAVLLLLAQVPPNAITRNQGYKTFWKIAPPTTPSTAPPET